MPHFYTRVFRMARYILKLSGKRFGNILVFNKATSKSWYCKCDCGTLKIIYGSDLTSGKTKSCGCFRKKVNSSRAVHGMSNTAEYEIWCSMKKRCENKNSAMFRHYGGRGINVCERWKKFEEFFSDMGPRPCGKSLDRINNNGNYEPSNCRWATATEQCENQRTNRLIYHNGKTCTVSQWSRETGINHSVIRNRLYRGWCEIDAITTPVAGALAHSKNS